MLFHFTFSFFPSHLPFLISPHLPPIPSVVCHCCSDFCFENPHNSSLRTHTTFEEKKKHTQTHTHATVYTHRQEDNIRNCSAESQRETGLMCVCVCVYIWLCVRMAELSITAICITYQPQGVTEKKALRKHRHSKQNGNEMKRNHKSYIPMGTHGR